MNYEKYLDINDEFYDTSPLSASQAAALTREVKRKEANRREEERKRQNAERTRREKLNIHFSSQKSIIEKECQIHPSSLMGNGLLFSFEACPDTEEWLKKHGYSVQYEINGSNIKTRVKV